MRMLRKAFTPVLFTPQLLHPTTQCLAGAVADGCALCSACDLSQQPLTVSANSSKPRKRAKPLMTARQAAAYK